MTNVEFEYDVAFSFLQEDEKLAFEINDLIQDRYKTFIYSQHQNELVGFDGEAKFNEVFGGKARLVAVLYRDNWGKTSWTRIEETAIRNRAFNEGFDFTIFINLNPKDTVPQWVPKNRIYADFERWGIKVVAAIIENKIQDAGGNGKPETLEEQALRNKRKYQLEVERKNYLKTPQAFADAQAEAGDLLTILKRTSKTLEDKATNFCFDWEDNPGRKYILRYAKNIIGYALHFEWTYNLNSPILQDAYLTVFIIKYDVSNNLSTFVQDQQLKGEIIQIAYFKFNRNISLSLNGWSTYRHEQQPLPTFISQGEFYRTEYLIEIWLRSYLPLVHKLRIQAIR